ncbi:MAG: D-glycero-beta-D-manno-heptose 1-phosphate adenylyltransferase [Candidatus Marinimicrobia bacterium]|nr:D-glycero-beta-D-manno-heptose 1-phosphate adenylyltransferase [Candidatus Neomarinimicrobiota bacterium]
MLYSKNEIKTKLQIWREASKIIVFTNGCFDLLHKGHKSLLQAAKNLGDILIVGLNSDASVRILKGDNRPIETQEKRAHKLLKLEFVNGVCIFEDQTPRELIKLIRPNFLVKGGDYKKSKIVGSRTIKKWNGKVRIVPLLKGYSTSSIIKKNKREGLV